jgi:glycosyltransferase involved in cell wall biosynthesis
MMNPKSKSSSSKKVQKSTNVEKLSRLLTSRNLNSNYLADKTIEGAVEKIRISHLFSTKFYVETYAAADPLINLFDPISHYLSVGFFRGYRPSPHFDANCYLKENPHIVREGMNPFLHYVLYGVMHGKGRQAYVDLHPVDVSGQSLNTDSGQSNPDARHIEVYFDREFYLLGFPQDERPEDPVAHYLTKGWLEGRNPNKWFFGQHYLADNPDVRVAGINPFLHYCIAGKHENRNLRYADRNNSDDLYKSHSFSVAAGPYFEEFEPDIGVGRRTRAKVLAYYLPQFHAIPLNDRHWGTGFTEWRNLPRGMPRFSGHIQPRIPRDLGCYDLSAGDIMHRQIAMAKAAGLFGFCFYYYWFDGERVLDMPLERLLADPTMEFPFCLMWANENWTRTWDGQEKEVIVQQSYHEADEAPLVDDLARHMTDRRYIRIGDRPVLFIYRIGHLPDAQRTLKRIRRLFQDRHNLDPLVFQGQTFGDNDPDQFGTDGAIEFPPHKLHNYVADVSNMVENLDRNFRGSIHLYESLVGAATSQTKSGFPLIRTVFPSWDNDSRRPGRSTIFAHSTPGLFEQWLDWAIKEVDETPIYGEKIVCINAWNEWAEGAYLEPDVHFGAAYLNAVARSVYGTRRRSRKKILLVGHDAHCFGAQILLLRIGQKLSRQFGIEVSYLLPQEAWNDGYQGEILDSYKSVGPVHVIKPGDPALANVLMDMKLRGYEAAITNTALTGTFVSKLKEAGFRVVSLIHEMPALMNERNLSYPAGEIARLSDVVVFPANTVKSGFTKIAGLVRGKVLIRPQGLYSSELLQVPAGENGLRKELGLPVDSKIILGVGYADLRKGIDRFVATALSICSDNPKVYFLWVGRISPEATNWYMHEIAESGLQEQIRLLGPRDDVARFYAASQVFYLSSREDPFPSVVLEAMAMGLTVVGHAGCGGCDDLIERHGLLVQSRDPRQAATIIANALAQKPATLKKRTDAQRAEITENYDFESYAFELIKLATPEISAVSVIIPNYNYSRYLRDRLWSVIDQDYPLREVLVLDDASTDESIQEINEISRVSPIPIALHVNTKNSGSVFRQWRKAVELSRGDYIWIAEADDIASPHFVQEVMKHMRSSGSVLGFADSRQIDESGLIIGESYKAYLNGVKKGVFDKSFDMDGREFLSRFLAVKNVILNVSGTIIRRDAFIEALSTVGESLSDFNVAGDWRLYAEVCAKSGNRVCYIADPLNTHRRHGGSVSGGLKSRNHLQEIRAMHETCSRLVKLSRSTISLQKKHLSECESYLADKSAVHRMTSSL